VVRQTPEKGLKDHKGDRAEKSALSPGWRQMERDMDNHRDNHRPSVIAKTVQTTDIWLHELENFLGPGETIAWKVLSTVLHKLRDRLPLSVAAHLGAQLPLLVRGAYYDQFEPDKLPMRCSYEEFVAEVDEWLADIRPVDPEDAIAAVFALLSRHIPSGQISKVQAALPKELRSFWYRAEEDVIPPPTPGRQQMQSRPL
jgi:uncharacterized protein (DUF2267 family)